VVLVSLLFGLGVLVNGPLMRFRPRWALGTGEVAVAFAMMLVACAVPSNGLMRYWPPSLVAPLWHAQSNVEFRKLLVSMDLPAWIFPKFAGAHMPQWIHDAVVDGYVGRWTADSTPPYSAWIQPALTWGIFIFALYGCMVCLMGLVHHQWYENERLAFPLATVELALVQQPEPGRFLNGTFRRRGFWVAFACVFFLHILQGGSQYWPRYIPSIPLSFDLRSLMADPPLIFTDTQVKQASIYFSIIGVTYFISTPVAFSLWFFFIVRQMQRIGMGMFTGDGTPWGEWDVHSGGLLAYALITLWIGRRHWRLVIAQALRGARPDEPRGRYLSHRTAFWGFLICIAVMIGFFVCAGAGVGGAAVIVLLLVTLLFTMTRIVAETGLIQGQLLFPLYRPFQLMLMSFGWAPVSAKTFYYASMLQMTYYDNRESLPVYAAHAFKVTDQTVLGGRPTATDERAQRRFGRQLVGLMFLALAVAFVVSLGSMLWTEYHFSATLDKTSEQPLNAWPVRYASAGTILGNTLQYSKGHISSPFNPWWHLGGGFLITLVLSYLRLQYTWWPLLPVGCVMMPTGPVLLMWFSIFLGWGAKVLVLRLGGGKFYQNLKPVFIGLIVGEAGAAGFWLIVALILSALGMPYEQINILPY
jgi:hypothetical protein